MKTPAQIAAEAWEKIVSYFGINTSPHESEGIDAIKSSIEEAYDQGYEDCRKLWRDSLIKAESRAAHARDQLKS